MYEKYKEKRKRKQDLEKCENESGVLKLRQYLKDARTNLGYTQSDVANHLGVSQNYYCDIENGERQRDMKVTTLIKLSSILKIPVEKMLEEERSMRGV